MRVISFVNLKGGVAKTTSVINTAAILARIHSKRVLVVDADSQCNTTDFLGVDNDDFFTLAEMLLEPPGPECFPLQCIHKSELQGVAVIPASDRLMDLDLTKVSEQKVYPRCLDDLRIVLENTLDPVTCAPDFMLIDCPPAFNAASTAALMASDEVVIPIKLDAFSLRGMANLTRQIANMREINPKLRLAGLLPTMWYRGEPIRQAEEMLRKSGLPVFSHIRRTPKVDAMTFDGRPLLESSPQCAAQRDYLRFVDELMKGGEQNGRV